MQTRSSNFFSEARAELLKVKWSTKSEVVKMTSLVIIVSLIVGLYIGGLDFLFTKLMSLVLK